MSIVIEPVRSPYRMQPARTVATTTNNGSIATLSLPDTDMWVCADTLSTGSVTYEVTDMATYVGKIINILKSVDTTSTGNTVTLSLPAGYKFNTSPQSSNYTFSDAQSSYQIVFGLETTDVVSIFNATPPSFTGIEGVENSASSTGDGLVIDSPVTSGVAALKGLIAGSNITLTPGANDITVSATSSSVPDLGFSVILRNNVTDANYDTGTYITPSGLLVDSGATYYNINGMYSNSGFTIPATGKWLVTATIKAFNDYDPVDGTTIREMGAMI